MVNRIKIFSNPIRAQLEFQKTKKKKTQSNLSNIKNKKKNFKRSG